MRTGVRASGVSIALLCAACLPGDPAVRISLTNACPSTVWVQVSGHEPTEELPAGETLETVAIGYRTADVAWSTTKNGRVKVQEVRHGGPPVVLRNRDCDPG
jgi:hypothetical protein